MKLYYSRGACSLSPHIALREAGIPFEAVLAPTKTKKLPDGTDYLTINPKGQVPLLELDNGERLTEVAAIVQYIADLAPRSNLAPPAGTLPRYRLIEWLSYISGELHKSFSPLFAPTTPDETKDEIRAKLRERLQWVDGQLAGKSYLLGEDFTVADAFLYTVTNWARVVNVDLTGLENLLAYRERITARPAVQAALEAEGLKK